MEKNTVRVYDTISKKIVEVEVSDEVRTHYNRTLWNIDDNDESFFKHEIQFSALIGGHEYAFENFREFITDYDVEKETDRKIFTERLHNCLKLLSESERNLITMLYFENKTERECAKILCTSQQNVHKNKKLILCKLNKLLTSE